MSRFWEEGAPGQNIRIYPVFECWGGRWSALVGSRMRSEAFQKANDLLMAAQRAEDSFRVYGNGRKCAGMDGNGWKQTQTQAGSEVKRYLKAKTYD